MTDHEWIGSRELAALLHVQEPTVRAWADAGRLPKPFGPPRPPSPTSGRRPYGYWRWPRETMLAWLREHKLIAPARRRKGA